MLQILIKNSFRAFIEPFKPQVEKSGKKKFGRSLILILVYIYLVVMYSFMFYETFAEIAVAYSKVNLGWLYYVVSSISSAMMTFGFTVLTSEQYLYEAKDNDLLLSMPIKKEYLIIARSLPLLLLGCCTSAITLIPTLISWCINVGIDALMIINFIIAFPFFVFIPTTFGIFFGWVINLIAKKTGSKTAVKAICSIILIIMLEIMISFMENAAQEVIFNSITLKNIFKAILPIYLYGQAVGAKSVIYLLLYIVCTSLIVYLLFRVLASTYISSITKSYNIKLKKYKEKHMKQQSPDMMLLKCEQRRLTRSFIYFINAGFSTIMMLISIIALLINGKDIDNLLMQMGSGFENEIGIIGAGVICLLLSTTLISACSISLEGKNWWISKTLPVDTKNILLAKVANQIIFTTPVSLVFSVVIISLLKPTLLTSLNIILIPFGYSILISFFGVIINAQIPKLDWRNEAVVVKQSASVFICMCVNALYIIIPSVLYYFVFLDLISLDKFATIFMVFTYIVIYLTYCVLVTDTKKRYESLG